MESYLSYETLAGSGDTCLQFQTWEVEAEGSGVQGHPLDSMRLCLKIKLKPCRAQEMT